MKRLLLALVLCVLFTGSLYADTIWVDEIASTNFYGSTVVTADIHAAVDDNTDIYAVCVFEVDGEAGFWVTLIMQIEESQWTYHATSPHWTYDESSGTGIIGMEGQYVPEPPYTLPDGDDGGTFEFDLWQGYPAAEGSTKLDDSDVYDWDNADPPN